jgi:hypothetical protein
VLAAKGAEAAELVAVRAVDEALDVELDPFSAWVSWFIIELRSLETSPTAWLAVDCIAAAAAERGSCNEVRKASAWLENWPDGLADIRVAAAEDVPLAPELVGRLCPAAEDPSAALGPLAPIVCISIWSA